MIFLQVFWAVDYDGIYSGTYSSNDGGETWPTFSKPGLTRLLADPADSFTLYARQEDPYENPYMPIGNLAKTTDGGRTWSVKLPKVSSFAFSPRKPGLLLASRNDGTLWKSNDGAESWECLGNWAPFDKLFFHPGKTSLVLAQPSVHAQNGATGDIWKSEDEGATWTVFPTAMDRFSFVFHPSDPEVIYGIQVR
jgi:photosystem II stability/assembly factor-like uncharacterized protein